MSAQRQCEKNSTIEPEACKFTALENIKQLMDGFYGLTRIIKSNRKREESRNNGGYASGVLQALAE